MSRTSRRRVFVIATLLLAWNQQPLFGQTPTETEPLTWLEYSTEPIRRQEFRVLGAHACGSSGCHGGARPGITNERAKRGSEFSLWFENDPHARSRQTMCGKKSAEITEALGITKNGRVLDSAGYDNCLACHNSTRGLESNHSFSTNEGVGCAACHGPSEMWIGRHYSRDFHPPDLLDSGFVDLSDLVTRARVCASCHIGDSDRDMNHDIIAAGHPPLRYEFATYHNRLPKHWRDEQEGTADFEARLWLAGQIAGLDADLSLLASRATDGSTNSTWPELSEFRCSTCHHDQNIIEDAPASKPLRGLAAYSQWNQLGLWFLDESPSQSTGLNSQDSYQGILTDELLELQKVMESKYRPDPFEVRNAAVSARFALDDLVKSRPLPDFSATQLASALQQKQGQGTITSNWESAAQYYLAAIATRRAWPGGPSGPNGTVADSTRAAIRYPLSRDLNVFPFDAGKERRYKRGEIEILFKSLAESLTSPEYEIE